MQTAQSTQALSLYTVFIPPSRLLNKSLLTQVKCDRRQPSCGWCSRNGVLCEYKERKKPGLRAGYGRELEQRLNRLEEILRSHSQILHQSMSNFPQQNNNPPGAVNSSSQGLLPSDQGTPQEKGPTMFHDNEPLRTPQAETALFLQKPALQTTKNVSQCADLLFPGIVCYKSSNS